MTLEVTFLALAAAVAGGVALALLFAQSKWIELGLFPYAIVLQVTPIIAIAPLILIYVDNTHVALVLCAWIVAFFPILANTTLGLNSADHNLVDLFRLHGATRWQTLRYLRIPTALPYLLRRAAHRRGPRADRRGGRRIHRRHRQGAARASPFGFSRPATGSTFRGCSPRSRSSPRRASRYLPR